MFNFRELIGLKKTHELSSGDIRQRQAANERRLTALTTEAQDLALPEVEGDETATTQRAALHRQIDALERDRATLAGALTAALKREHATRRAERDRQVAELKEALAALTKDRDAMLTDRPAQDDFIAGASIGSRDINTCRNETDA